MLCGYPSSLYLLALGYRKHGTGALNLRSAFSMSESLFDWQRSAIEDAFGVKVFNWYGNSEMCGHITECEHGTLHGRHEHSLIEVLDTEGHPCGPGETGRLVATGFHNRLFPLIRYDVGDEVTLSEATSCPCGRTGLLVRRIEGRNEDYIATPDGRLVGRLDHVFKDTVNVQEAQIVQREIDEVIFRIVKRPEYTTNDEQEVIRQGTLRLGSSIRIRVDYVDQIDRSASGKFRFIVSEIDQRALLKNLAETTAPGDASPP
jgi:phenylacetate-CoA ligase